MIVAVANLKGGTAKTTTAVYLARELSALVVDADPQGSALGWSDAVAEEGGTLGVEVTHLPDPKLADRLPKADRLVIDCSPRDHRITDAAITVADLVVVPTATTAADMERTWATLDLATRREHDHETAVWTNEHIAGQRDALVFEADRSRTDLAEQRAAADAHRPGRAEPRAVRWSVTT